MAQEDLVAFSSQGRSNSSGGLNADVVGADGANSVVRNTVALAGRAKAVAVPADRRVDWSRG